MILATCSRGCSNVRMIEFGEDFGFALEPREAFRVPRHRRGQDFDRDAAFQIRVGGLVHLAHATHADLGDDFIGAEASTWSQGQFVWIIGAELQRAPDRSCKRASVELRRRRRTAARSYATSFRMCSASASFMRVW